MRTKAVMVAMRMRQENRVEVMDPLPDEKRHDNFLADRFCCRRAVAGLALFETTAGIDHDCVRARRLHENRIALPDVDKRYAEIVPRRPRRPQDKRACEHRDRERRNLESHASLSRLVARSLGSLG